MKEESSEKDVWWGPVNKPMTPDVSLKLSVTMQVPIPCFLPILAWIDCMSLSFPDPDARVRPAS